MRLWEQRILKPERSSSNAVLKGHVPVHGHISYRYSSYVCVSLLNTLSGGILTPFKLTRPKKVPPPPPQQHHLPRCEGPAGRHGEEEEPAGRWRECGSQGTQPLTILSLVFTRRNNEYVYGLLGGLGTESPLTVLSYLFRRTKTFFLKNLDSLVLCLFQVKISVADPDLNHFNGSDSDHISVPELLGSVVDPDPEFQFRIQQKVKKHIIKTVNSGLFVLLDSSVEQRMANSC